MRPNAATIERKALKRGCIVSSPVETGGEGGKKARNYLGSARALSI
jgi:hypothetical protein